VGYAVGALMNPLKNMKAKIEAGAGNKYSHGCVRARILVTRGTMVGR